MTSEFDFSGFGLRVTGDDPALAGIAEEWAGFAGRADLPWF